MNNISNKKAESAIFLIISIWMFVLVLLGFWPKYFGPLISGTNKASTILHFHTIVFVAWIFLFFYQIYQIFSRNYKKHTQMGKYIVYFIPLMILTGLLVGFIRSDLHVMEGNSDKGYGLLQAIMRDMGFFGGFIIAAISFKNKPEIHKRMMLGAATMIMIAAASRWVFSLESGGNLLFYLVWLFPVWFYMVFELVKNKKIHKVTFYVLIILLMADFILSPKMLLEVWGYFNLG